MPASIHTQVRATYAWGAGWYDPFYGYYTWPWAMLAGHQASGKWWLTSKDRGVLHV